MHHMLLSRRQLHNQLFLIMSNPFLSINEIKETFHKLYLEGNYSFLEDDLERMADAFIAAAAPKITRLERDMCINFVRSLNSPVAAKLQEIRGNL